MKKFFEIIKRIVRSIVILSLLIVCLLIIINVYVKVSTSDQIISKDQLSEIGDVDCIVVLGCSVTPDQKPSNMLEQRLIQGISLYDNDISDVILMSGDHQGDYYDEVTVMKNYAIDNGVPSPDIFLDHYGLSTYESIYRAKYIYGAQKIIIVTQEYHLYRALYVANSLGIEAYGIAASDGGDKNDIKYDNRDIREFFARVKDFTNAILKPEATYNDEEISLDDNGEITHNR